MGLDWSIPLEIVEIKNKQVVQPVLAITATKYKHHVLDDTCSVELPHGRFPANDAGNVERQLLNSFLQVNEYDV